MKYRKAEAKAYGREHMKGIWAAIPYPFTPDDEIDEPALRRDIRHYIDALKIDGFFCGGFLSEFWSLTLEEKRRGQEIVVHEAGGKAQVIAHTGCASVKDTVGLTRHAEEIGADYAIIVNPPFAGRTDETVYAYYKYICDRVEIGISLFNSPYLGYSLPPPLISRLADIENIFCIKDADSTAHGMMTRQTAGDRIIVSDPDEESWFTNLSQNGQQVYMSSPAPYLYQRPGRLLLRQYTDLLLRGQKDEALSVYLALEPIRKAADKWLWTPWKEGRLPIAYVKCWAEMLGMSGGPVRPPLVPPTPREKDELKKDLEAAGLV